MNMNSANFLQNLDFCKCRSDSVCVQAFNGRHKIIRGIASEMSDTNGNGIINPNENLDIPKWISAEYFKNVLTKDEPEHVKVLNFTPIAAIPPGENFTSVMLRIHMNLEMKDGTTKHKTYLLKTELDADRGGSMISELSLFSKEMEMYRTYLPAFEGLYKAAGVTIQLAPRCLFNEVSSDRTNFVFEDLRVKNFANVNRLKGFNMQEMRYVLRKLAEFHAASVVYAEQNGPYPAQYKYGFVNMEKSYEGTKMMFESRMVFFKEAMLKWGLDDAKKYVKKFPTFEQYWKCIESTIETEKNTFNVLTHGDFWSSNIMMKHNADGTVDEALLLDFQICKWGAPAEDLIFFISISAAKDIRIKEYEHFVAIYHERLIECLKLLKYEKPLPKLRDLQMDMYRENISFYAFFSVFNHLLVVLLPSDKDSNIHTLMSNDEKANDYKMRMLTNPLFVEAMKDLFPFYHHRGLFNFEDYEQ